MLYGVTRTGIVISLATARGTPTSVTERLGSGEMTVREEKFTRLPRERTTEPAVLTLEPLGKGL